MLGSAIGEPVMGGSATGGIRFAPMPGSGAGAGVVPPGGGIVGSGTVGNEVVVSGTVVAGTVVAGTVVTGMVVTGMVVTGTSSVGSLTGGRGSRIGPADLEPERSERSSTPLSADDDCALSTPTASAAEAASTARRTRRDMDLLRESNVFNWAAHRRGGARGHALTA
jgi:hypothetical protein